MAKKGLFKSNKEKKKPKKTKTQKINVNNMITQNKMTNFGGGY